MDHFGPNFGNRFLLRAERCPMEGARGREVAPECGPGPRGGPWRWPEAEVSKLLDCLALELFVTPFWYAVFIVFNNNSIRNQENEVAKRYQK